MINTIRRTLIGFTVGLAVLVPAVAGHAAPVKSAPTVAVPALIGNVCHLPTHANQPSVFLQSFNDCHVCLSVAGDLRSHSIYNYYCTYNPSNDKTDLHRDLLIIP
jgi:hypothetical protein